MTQTTTGRRFSEAQYTSSQYVTISPEMARFSTGVNFFHADGLFIGSLFHDEICRLLDRRKTGWQLVYKSTLRDYFISE